MAINPVWPHSYVAAMLYFTRYPCASSPSWGTVTGTSIKRGFLKLETGNTTSMGSLTRLSHVRFVRSRVVTLIPCMTCIQTTPTAHLLLKMLGRVVDGWVSIVGHTVGPSVAPPLGGVF